MEEVIRIAAVGLFLMVLRRAAPRGWRFLTMVTWTLAATNRVVTVGSIEGSGNVLLGANN